MPGRIRELHWKYSASTILSPVLLERIVIFPSSYAQTEQGAFRAIPGNQRRVKAVKWSIFTVFCAQNGLSMYIIKHIAGSRDQVFLENIAEGQQKNEPDVSYFSKVPCSTRILFTSMIWLIWGRVQVQWSRSFSHQGKEPDCEFNFTQPRCLTFTKYLQRNTNKQTHDYIIMFFTGHTRNT